MFSRNLISSLLLCCQLGCGGVQFRMRLINAGARVFEGEIKNKSRRTVEVSEAEQGLLRIDRVKCNGRRLDPIPGAGSVEGDARRRRRAGLRSLHFGESIHFKVFDLVEYHFEPDAITWTTTESYELVPGKCVVRFGYLLNDGRRVTSNEVSIDGE